MGPCPQTAPFQQPINPSWNRPPAACSQPDETESSNRSTEAPQQSHPTTSDYSRGCAGQGESLHPGRPLASYTVAISWCCPVVLVSVLKDAPTKTRYHQSHPGALGLFQDSSFVPGLRLPEERCAWSEEPVSPRRCSVMSRLAQSRTATLPQTCLNRQG